MAGCEYPLVGGEGVVWFFVTEGVCKIIQYENYNGWLLQILVTSNGWLENYQKNYQTITKYEWNKEFSHTCFKIEQVILS